MRRKTRLMTPKEYARFLLGLCSPKPETDTRAAIRRNTAEYADIRGDLARVLAEAEAGRGLGEDPGLYATLVSTCKFLRPTDLKSADDRNLYIKELLAQLILTARVFIQREKDESKRAVIAGNRERRAEHVSNEHRKWNNAAGVIRKKYPKTLRPLSRLAVARMVKKELGIKKNERTIERALK